MIHCTIIYCNNIIQNVLSLILILARTIFSHTYRESADQCCTVRHKNYECSPCTPPSTMGELILSSNLSSPLYIIEWRAVRLLEPTSWQLYMCWTFVTMSDTESIVQSCYLKHRNLYTCHRHLKIYLTSEFMNRDYLGVSTITSVYVYIMQKFNDWAIFMLLELPVYWIEAMKFNCRISALAIVQFTRE